MNSSFLLTWDPVFIYVAFHPMHDVAALHMQHPLLVLPCGHGFKYMQLCMLSRDSMLSLCKAPSRCG